MKLLSRDEFRSSVFARDRNRCVICQATGPRLDAHHIIERRLFQGEHEFGGYVTDNGATLCDDGTLDSCHLKAEATLISCEEIRKAAGIDTVVLPEHLYADQSYDKWGNPLVANGMRLKGELFHDESVQKILQAGKVLHLFLNRIRHPRTYHLPYSPKALKDRGDDKMMRDTSGLEGERVIVTAKMDGSQSTLYRDGLHARTINFQSDHTWHWLQNFHARFQYDIPEGWRIVAENLYGGYVQDIQYQNLPSYVMAIMVFDDLNYCLSWDETAEWIAMLSASVVDSGEPRGFPLVPVLYDGPYDEKAILGLVGDKNNGDFLNGDPLEGFVVRVARRFHYREFPKVVGKFVRECHQVRHNGLFRKNNLANLPA